MDQALKERIVGAVVLVGLAVVIIPLVLDGPAPPLATPVVPAPDVPAVTQEGDGSKTYRYDLDAPAVAPAEAGVTTAPLAAAPTPAELAARPAPVAPTSGAASAPAAPTASVSAPASTATGPAPAEPVQRTPAPMAKPGAPARVDALASAPRGDTAWAAQAGTFGKAATARELAARLNKLGFKAFVTEYRDGGRTLYRVRVGPVKSRADAETLAKRVSAQAKLDARPVPHP